MNDEQYYSLKEISTILKVAYLTVYRWVQSDKLKAHKIGKQYRVSEKTLHSFIHNSDK